MKKFIGNLWVLALLLIGSHANSAPTAQDSQFDYSGFFAGGGTISGSIFINTQTGSLDSGSVLIAGLPDNLAAFDGVYAPSLINPFYASEIGLIALLGSAPTSELITVLPFGGTQERSHLGAPSGQGLVGYVGQTLCYACIDTTELVNAEGTLAGAASGSIVDPPSGGAVSAPEIDAGGAAAGLTLLLFGLLLLAGDRRQRHRE